ncbi:MAG TPA: bifunctional aspartate kinase/homoserine dehydrogenase I [Rudaea sp.]|jgi:aspartokinase/homoserine dehydrogenase 1
MNAVAKSVESLPAAVTVVAHKFGGSSLADAARIQHVAELVRTRPEPQQVVVVSAMRGVTDALLAIADDAARGHAQWRKGFDALRRRHIDTARDLLGAAAGPTCEWLEGRFGELAETINAIAILRGAGHGVAEAASGNGEVWSAHLLHAYLRANGADYALLDAREVLIVRREELGAAVDWDATRTHFDAWRKLNPHDRVVVTGYIARDENGRDCVLGRNGSDFSGAIFAALYDAAELHIWTDVDGVLSADPRIEPEAVTLAAMSYDEACELAYFGAKVIHPQTMAPAIAAGLPIFIRNTFKPAHPGTRIDAVGDAHGPVKGLTLAHDLALLNVEGTGMLGVPGTAERVFAALRAARVSVVMISQGSSEHSICCVVKAAEADTARAAMEGAFARELHDGQISRIALARDISVLAAVGDRMAGVPGVAARLFDALARSHVNIRAIAQGASERNISIALARDQATVALRAAHAAFWLSPQTISVGLIGPGKVGAALLDQISAAAPRLRSNSGLDLRLRAILSTKYLLADEMDLGSNWRDRDADFVDNDIDGFLKHLVAAHLPHTVILDCSGSDAVVEHYAQWLGACIHVITPNKQAGAGPLERYRAIRAAATAGGARFRYEATVGAGLPIIQTLRDLLDTGDELVAAEGIFSGTLAWLFNRFDGSVPFSRLVHKAHALGYTEPDPRDDLSGIDVARKLVILAREAGHELSLADVAVESLVPDSLRDAGRDAFMARLAEFDAVVARRHAQAQANGCVLRHVARLHADGARVGLVELPRTHAFANLRLTDNVVQFTTRRYCDNPLVVQGPGAGPDVTAAGVFADLLRVAASLGARI